VQHIKKDYRQKDEITLRCGLCSIGIGFSKSEGKWHKHFYSKPIEVIYKNKKYLLDKDCFLKVKVNPKLLEKAFYDEYIK